MQYTHFYLNGLLCLMIEHEIHGICQASVSKTFKISNGPGEGFEPNNLISQLPVCARL